MARGLTWKTSAPKPGVAVEHWAKHDPHAILKALEAIPERKLGDDPIVKVYRLGQQPIAVRKMGPIDGTRVFKTLQRMAELKVSLVETPVALVTRPGVVQVVTLWKKGTRPFGHYLNDESVSLARKRATVRGAVREWARMNAKGFIHGHFTPDNLLVGAGGIPHLVDCSLVQEITSLTLLLHGVLPSGDPQARRRVFEDIEAIEGQTALLAALVEIRGTHESQERFGKELLEEYRAAFEKYSKKYSTS